MAAFSVMVRGMFTIFVMVPGPKRIVLRLFMSACARNFFGIVTLFKNR